MLAKTTIVLLAFVVDLSLFHGYLSGITYASPLPYAKPPSNGAPSFEQLKAQLLAQNAAARSSQRFGGETSYLNGVNEMANVTGNNLFGSETEQIGNTYEKQEGVDQIFGSLTWHSGSANKLTNVNGSTHFGSKTMQKNNVYTA